jgi:hypothetical protein
MISHSMPEINYHIYWFIIVGENTQKDKDDLEMASLLVVRLNRILHAKLYIW